MKFKYYLYIILAAAGTSCSITSCVDGIKFGNAFLEKAPGGDVTIDTIFNKADYARRFLWNTYTKLYYGLPYYWGEQAKMNVGMFETLSDSYHSHLSWDEVNRQMYPGTYKPGNSGKWNYTDENVWEGVRASYIFLENIDRVPDMNESEKARLKAEAKCIIASRYFDVFRHYGGVPLVQSSYSGTDNVYEIPRASVENTVNFMVKLLDEAAPDLPWELGKTPDSDGAMDDPSNWDGRFTRATAEGLKCKILAFAASPLFNSAEPYNTKTSASAEQQLAWWYGGYKPELWQQCLDACKKFFEDNAANGNAYKLVEATGTRPQDYRLAFRKAYYRRGNGEILLSTRVRYTTNNGEWNYQFHVWNGYGPYTPTEEYMELFPWKDGTPFVWDKLTEQQKQEMFMTNVKKDKPNEVQLTRDPRLYETIIVNQLPMSLDWTSGNMSGRFAELWVMGREAGNAPQDETSDNQYATGFANNKFYMYDDSRNQPTEWPYLRLSDIYLTYAEALAQTGNLTEAAKQVDVVRARVGLRPLEETQPSVLAGKDNMISAILDERAREFGLEDTRWYDLIRYKMKSNLEKQLHGLRIIRLDDAGNEVRYSWSDKSQGQPGYSATAPTRFKYERFPLTKGQRVWWQGFDTKWYLSAFPPTEINKGYGLYQNPGW